MVLESGPAVPQGWGLKLWKMMYPLRNDVKWALLDATLLQDDPRPETGDTLLLGLALARRRGAGYAQSGHCILVSGVREEAPEGPLL
jgi:hypothetical protein